VAFARLTDLARAQFARKPVRYFLVSVVAVGVSQITLLVCTVLLDWKPVPANLAAFVVSTFPSYQLNRAWVWGRRGNHQVFREVLPFWIVAFIGLGLSTLFVHLASLWSDAPLVTNAANLTAYGLLWVAKYLLLDQLLFPHIAEDAEASVAA
jgi:putative flippase GtrA